MKQENKGTYTVIDSPLGPIIIAGLDGKIINVSFGDTTDIEPIKKTEQIHSCILVEQKDDILLIKASSQLSEYFNGNRKDFDLPLNPKGTPFQEKVWNVLLTIPYGKTISYKEEALHLGGTRYSRAVGSANGKNPITIIIPCHRVIGSNGELAGYSSGIDKKRWLLEHENKVQGTK